MALLFFDGFEGGPSQAIKPEWLAGGGGTASLARSGGYGMQLTGTLSTCRIPASAKVTVGCAVTAAGGPFSLSFRGDTGATTHLTITATAGGNITLSLGATVVATAAVTFPSGVWRSVQAQATIADSGGRCIVKVDGVTIIDYTGDTKNGGTSTNIDTIGFVGQTAGGAVIAMDDLWICDGTDATATQGRPNNDFLGDLKVQPLLPDGNGALNQWTPSGAGTNAQQVDEVPPNTTDYVFTATAGNRDLYSVSDVPASTAQVLALRVGVYAQKSDAGAAGIKALLRDPAGTVDAGPTQPLSTTWTGYYGPLRFLKPSDGTVYSPADVNALQAGVEATS